MEIGLKFGRIIRWFEYEENTPIPELHNDVLMRKRPRKKKD